MYLYGGSHCSSITPYDSQKLHPLQMQTHINGRKIRWPSCENVLLKCFVKRVRTWSHTYFATFWTRYVMGPILSANTRKLAESYGESRSRMITQHSNYEKERPLTTEQLLTLKIKNVNFWMETSDTNIAWQVLKQCTSEWYIILKLSNHPCLHQSIRRGNCSESD